MMKVRTFIYIFSIFCTVSVFGQSESYQKSKMEKIKNGSVFTKIINRELPATIVYEDNDIIAFISETQF